MNTSAPHLLLPPEEKGFRLVGGVRREKLVPRFLADGVRFEGLRARVLLALHRRLVREEGLGG